MANAELPEAYRIIDEQISSGEFGAAERALADAHDRPELNELLRIKLDVRRGEANPSVAMQHLVALMRNHKQLPTALALYQEVSSLAYKSRESSLAHSHPPPPIQKIG